MEDADRPGLPRARGEQESKGKTASVLAGKPGGAYSAVSMKTKLFPVRTLVNQRESRRRPRRGKSFPEILGFYTRHSGALRASRWPEQSVHASVNAARTNACATSGGWSKEVASLELFIEAVSHHPPTSLRAGL